MLKAIEAVHSKSKKLNEPARYFKVLKATLRRKVTRCERGFDPVAIVHEKLGRKPILSQEVEEQLVDYCLVMEKKFFGLCRNDVRRMAHQLAERNIYYTIYHTERSFSQRLNDHSVWILCRYN